MIVVLCNLFSLKDFHHFMKLFKYAVVLTSLVNDDKLSLLITALITWLSVVTTFIEGIAMSEICSLSSWKSGSLFVNLSIF